MEVKGIRHEAFNCEKYVSGKSMEDVMADYGLTSVVKLGSNENMYGPYDVALNAMGEEVKKLNIYPEKNYIKLKKVVGEKFHDTICMTAVVLILHLHLLIMSLQLHQAHFLHHVQGLH